jgi:hypothetical protein
MKYIKTFELLYNGYKDDRYLIGNVSGNNFENLITKDLLDIIGVEIDYNDKNSNEDWFCEYNINVINFLKEIFLNKKITFYSKTKMGDKWCSDKIVNDIKLFVYKDDIYINIKIDDKWEIIANDRITRIYDYDASDKPEHKKLKIIRKGKKYNII